MPSSTPSSTNGSKPFIPYVRISDLGTREAGNNESESEQRSVIERIAQQRGLTLGDVIADEDISGMTFDRPGWKRAVQLIEDKEAGGIIAYDFKRISRGRTAESLTAIEEIEEAGGLIYDQSGQLSVKDEDLELITTVKAMIARQDIREKKRYLDTTRRRAIERGVHLAVPYGYTRSDGPGTPLALDPVEAPHARRCFELRAEGLSWKAIATKLNDDGILPRSFTKDGITQQGRWTHKTVRQLVTSKVYLGIAFSGDFETLDAHPALVSIDLWKRANASAGVKWGATDGRKRDGHLLTSLVRCASCGYASIRCGDYYRCRPAAHAQGCSDPVCIPAPALEEHVVEQFRAIFEDEDFIAVEDTSDVEQLDEKLSRAKIALSSAVRFAGSARAAGESDDVLEILDGEVESAKQLVSSLASELHETKLRAKGLDLPADFDIEGFDSLSIPERRHLLSLVFGAVVVRSAAVWREPVSARARILPREETPAATLAVIARAAGR